MKEQLSALIDDEFEISNADHLLIAAKSNGELSQAWMSYHLIRDAMRGDIPQCGQLTDRVMAALEDEPTQIAPSSAIINAAMVKKPLYKTSRFWSVAASVAAVMFVGLMLFQSQSVDENALNPIEIADNMPTEYLTAHQTYAPNSASYYVQDASFTEPR
ncbi:MAG: sigma-E factor negative regulatory protein [Methylophilus sp.]|nr:sigma-E factor negative regulatory protein [Methylophilus sp.]